MYRYVQANTAAARTKGDIKRRRGSGRLAMLERAVVGMAMLRFRVILLPADGDDSLGRASFLKERRDGLLVGGHLAVRLRPYY